MPTRVPGQVVGSPPPYPPGYYAPRYSLHTYQGIHHGYTMRNRLSLSIPRGVLRATGSSSHTQGCTMRNMPPLLPYPEVYYAHHASPSTIPGGALCATCLPPHHTTGALCATCLPHHTTGCTMRLMLPSHTSGCSMRLVVPLSWAGREACTQWYPSLGW